MILASTSRPEKEIAGIRMRREKIKLSLFKDYMIIYIESLKKSKKELLDLIALTR